MARRKLEGKCQGERYIVVAWPLGSDRGCTRLLLVQPAPLLPPLSATIRQNTVRVGDRERTYLIYIPASLPPRAALVIVLHGSAMDGARMRLCTGYEFDRLADQHSFVVFYPDGYPRN
jgi:polyhydroxybutyrate depolymerase